MSAAGLAEVFDADAGAPVDVSSQVLGTLRVPPDQVFTFPAGVYGFPQARRFALVGASREGFYWLQSLDFEALTFLLVDPFRFVEGYAVDLPSDAVEQLAADEAAEVVVLGIVTLPREEGDAPTVNLQGPVALNLRTRRGVQAVVESPFGIRHPLPLRPTSRRTP